MLYRTKFKYFFFLFAFFRKNNVLGEGKLSEGLNLQFWKRKNFMIINLRDILHLLYHAIFITYSADNLSQNQSMLDGKALLKNKLM